MPFFSEFRSVHSMFLGLDSKIGFKIDSKLDSNWVEMNENDSIYFAFSHNVDKSKRDNNAYDQASR